MKHRGIWIAILLILVFGGGITSYTGRVTGQMGALMGQTQAETAGNQEFMMDQLPAAASEKMASAPAAAGNAADETGNMPETAAALAEAPETEASAWIEPAAPSETMAGSGMQESGIAENSIPESGAREGGAASEADLFSETVLADASEGGEEALPQAAAEPPLAERPGSGVSNALGSAAGSASGSGRSRARASRESSSREREETSAEAVTQAEEQPVTQAASETEAAAGKVRAVISPLSGSLESPENETETESASSEEFYRRLEEIDSQIAKARAEDMDSSANAVLSAYTNEFRMWEKEEKAIYDGLLSAMDEENAESLKEEEKSWKKDRESQAQKAAAQYKGGATENVEYTATMSALTRDRAYELLDTYGEELDS